MDSSQPHSKGWYNGHGVCIFEDPSGNAEKPWHVVFEPLLPAPLQTPNGPVQVYYPESWERTLEAAKNTALALAQNQFSPPYKTEMDEWRIIRDA